MNKKKMLFVAGAVVAGALILRNRRSLEMTVRKTARKLRNELDPLQERVSLGLHDFARTVDELNEKLRRLAKALDAALGRLAA